MNRRGFLSGIAAAPLAQASSPVGPMRMPFSVGNRGAQPLTLTLGVELVESVIQQGIERVCVAQLSRSWIAHQMQQHDIFEPNFGEGESQ